MADLSDLNNDLAQIESSLNSQLGNFHFDVGKELSFDIKNNFNKQGYDSGNGMTAWTARSPLANKIYDTHSKYKNSPYKSSKPLLKQSLSLYNAIEFKHRKEEVEVGVFSRRNSFNGKDVAKYARDMNEGIENYWKEIKAKWRPAQRQFMPTPSERINPKMEKIIIKTWETLERKIFRKFYRE